MTAREILSEPLSLLLTLSALVLSTAAPLLHYHQFGEPTRMARDAGLSSLFTCGILFAAFGMARAMRREIESGTAQMTLTHAVSRERFFVAKCLGGLLAYVVFAVIVSVNMLTIVRGAEIGGELAARSGDLAKLWGVSVACSVATLVLPLVLAAVLNRFAHSRFVPCVFRGMVIVSLAGVAYRFNPTLAARLGAVALVAAFPGCVFAFAAGAFATRLKANACAGALTLLAAVSLPVAGNYFLSDALSRGGALPWHYAGLAALAALCAVLAIVALGLHLVQKGDFGIE